MSSNDIEMSPNGTDEQNEDETFTMVENEMVELEDQAVQAIQGTTIQQDHSQLKHYHHFHHHHHYHYGRKKDLQGSPSKSQPACEVEGCSKPRFAKFPHCSRSCYWQSKGVKVKQCARPQCAFKARIDPQNITMSFDYCSRKCFHQHSNHVSTTTLVFLGTDDRDFQLAVQASIQGGLGGQTVLQAARIIYPKALSQAHLEYGASRKMKSSLKFHGTRLECQSLSSSGIICSGSMCGACGILRHGFLATFIKSAPAGFYFAPDSNTSFQFSKPNFNGVRAMFLCNVFDHTVTNAVTICQDPQASLPRYVIFF
ncbi:hypothetical protein BGW38_007695 [Lunasporangiospora selenospora]|uniref:PARP catalytic domain-containing protein n=1 Tax=Lunasporangiospora selenospora TaxID=979761 RepID=A0A9P6KGH6_9FUNG|nr:hypothetical protein BGW38_007695 [Lunasporangiospora selenospora]